MSAESRRATLLSAIAAIPLLAWWLGWFPAVLDGTGLHYVAEARAFSFTDYSPASYGLTVWLVGWGGRAVAVVSLAQVVALATLLTVASRRFVRLGVPWWLAGGVPVLIAALPAVGNSVVALWTEVAGGLAALWVFTEMLAFAADPTLLDRPAPRLRLTAALALWWLYGGGGGVAVVLVVGVLWAVLRTRRGATVAAGTAVIVALVHLGAYSVLPVDGDSARAAEILVPVVADAYRHDPGSFDEEDLALMAEAAPLDVWAEAADCHDASLLTTDRQFDTEALRAADGQFRTLGWRVATRQPVRTLGQRLCAASFLWIPAQETGRFYYFPAYAIPRNELGLRRDPVFETAFNATKAILVRTQQPDRLWLWWRPALPLALAAAAYAVAGLRGHFRLLWPAVVVAAQVIAVVVTAQSPGMRPIFGLYVTALLSTPLVWPALRRVPRI